MIPHFPSYTKYPHVMMRFKLKIISESEAYKQMPGCLGRQRQAAGAAAAQLTTRPAITRRQGSGSDESLPKLTC